PTPSFLGTIDVPAGTETLPHVVTVPVDPPVVVTEGDLYVAIHWAGTYPDVLCVDLCEPSTADQTYESSSSTEPIPWREMHASGWPGDLALQVTGRSAAP